MVLGGVGAGTEAGARAVNSAVGPAASGPEAAAERHHAAPAAGPHRHSPAAADGAPALIYGIDDRPPLGRSLVLAVQQVLVSNIWLDALFIAGVGGLSAHLATSLVTVTFLAAGLATLVQTLKLVRLPIVEGPSSAFDAMAIAAARSGQLAAASTGLIIGSGIVLIASLSGVLHRIRAIFTPAVTGTVIVLVGLLLAQFTFLEFFGGNTAAPTFAKPMTLAIALMIAMAFSPKVAAVLVSTPAPVVGGLFLPAAATVVWSGIATLGRVRTDDRATLVATVALMAGLGVPSLGAPLVKALPGPLADLASQGIVVGTVTAIALQVILVILPAWVARRAP